MKNSIKLALVAFVVSATIISCDPPKAKTDETGKIDTEKTAPDTTGKDSVLIQKSAKVDSVKK